MVSLQCRNQLNTDQEDAVRMTERHSSFFVVSHQYHVAVVTGKEAKNEK